MSGSAATSTDGGTPQVGPVAGDGAGAMSPPACQPTEEACDAKDNDCDGQIDESIAPLPCGVDRGICRAGTIKCNAGVWDDPMTHCEGAIAAMPQEICDSQRQDENCNGVSNEGCECAEGETMPCSTAKYTCKPGTMVCTNGKYGTECRGETPGEDEVCDGLDNDCDGRPDNGGDTLCPSGQHCAGASRCVECKSDTDCSRLAGPCKVATCSSGGKCSANIAPANTSCNSNGGHFCDRVGECAECTENSQCGGGDPCHTPSCTRGSCSTVAKVCEAGKECSASGECVTKKTGIYTTCSDRSTCETDACTLGFCTKGCKTASECPGGKNNKKGFCYGGACFADCAATADCPTGLVCGVGAIQTEDYLATGRCWGG